MRIIFFGTPDFACVPLASLCCENYQIVAVYCPPDRPKGRGRVLSACAVKQYALTQNLKIYQPQTLKNPATQKQLALLNADVIVVVAYGQILPTAVLNIPRYGCVNIHPSLLPRWRGAAPIERAILAGDKETGISITKMDAGLDTGAILASIKCNISPTDNAQSLHDKLAVLGAKTLIKVLHNLANSTPKAQSSEGATYAKKLSKNEAWIDWSQTAEQIDTQIRAMNPYPIAQTMANSDKFSNKILRIFSSSVITTNKSAHNKPYGSVLKQQKEVCDIATGKGILRLNKVQLGGKKVLLMQDFSNSCSLIKFTPPPP